MAAVAVPATFRNSRRVVKISLLFLGVAGIFQAAIYDSGCRIISTLWK